MKNILIKNFQKNFQKNFKKNFQKNFFKKNFKNIPVMCYYKQPKITTLICIIYQ